MNPPSPFRSFLLLAIAGAALLSAPRSSGQETEEPPEESIRMRGLRFNTKADPDSDPNSAASATAPSSRRKTELPEGALTVGVVAGQSKLPPELAELAREGAVAIAGQEWEEARDAYLKMVKEAPDNALAYANLGVAEHQLGNLLAAEGNLHRSLQINPSIAQNWQTLGLVQYERGDLVLAISSLMRAIHEEPGEARSRLYLATVIRDYGWTDAATTELERAVQTDPGLADAHFNLAVTYLDADPPRLELARRHYYAARDLGAEESEEIETIFSKTDEGRK
ncbi:MAG: tetratricopeptide repeat protein [Verrucomicrobiales bacterium]